jgi:hypothetical protein
MNKRHFPALAQAAGGLRRIALALALAGAATAASANPPAARGNDGFLALGDSVVFGYITAAGYAYGNPMNFLGYPAYVGTDLRFSVANALCPGETTAGFISSTGADNGCRPYRANFPLHVSYSATQSDTQLNYAMSYLQSHKQTRLVTIGLGANDSFLLQAACNGDPKCIQAGLPALLGTIYTNMSTILQNLRSTGYRGVLMVVNYYSLDYADSEAVKNSTFAKAQYGFQTVKDGSPRWRSAATLSGF